MASKHSSKEANTADSGLSNNQRILRDSLQHKSFRGQQHPHVDSVIHENVVEANPSQESLAGSSFANDGSLKSSATRDFAQSADSSQPRISDDCKATHLGQKRQSDDITNEHTDDLTRPLPKRSGFTKRLTPPEQMFQMHDLAAKGSPQLPFRGGPGGSQVCGGPLTESHGDGTQGPTKGQYLGGVAAYDSLQPVENGLDGDTSLLLQPDTRPITAEQLLNEVKGIYAGLVMVEKKCVEIIAQRASTGGKLSNDDWQALIAIHRTLLHEHHDFFLASQHPTASPALRRLAQKYAMPARLWRNGIHAFLELLRQQLPDSYDHMLAFVYIAYSMTALLKESVPSFLETWIECLGDLARYRMAIEEIDMRDREIWSNVARMWYNKAADRSPNVGRIQHHLAVLARPVIVQQLFYYSKSLVSVVPFINARESIMLLFSPFLDEEKAANTFQKYAVIESSLVTAFGMLFTRGRVVEYTRYAAQFNEHLDTSITRMGAKWKTQGPEVASSLMAGLLDYGNEKSWLWKAYNDNMAVVKSRRADPEETDLINLEHEDAENREALREEFWQTVNEDFYEFVNQPATRHEAGPEGKFESSDDVAAHVLPLFHQTTSTVAQKIGDKNIVPFMSFILSFLWSLAYIPGGLMYIESYVPWMRVITFLNTLSRSAISEERVESELFPQPISGTGRQLPEDFPMRGLIWAQYVFPVAFFRHSVTDEDERMLELPSHGPPRAERCLWLGIRLAALNRYFTYNVGSKQFEPLEYALALDNEMCK